MRQGQTVYGDTLRLIPSTFAELKDFLDMPIKNFSSGMAARLGFSIATVVKPDILICDEVLAVGDYAFQRKCERRMSDMRDAGTTLLYVSHSMESVRKICDHALWLDKGIVKASAEKYDTIARAYLNSLSGVPDVKENINRIEELSDDSCKSLSIFCSPEARRKGTGLVRYTSIELLNGEGSFKCMF
ncbi:MAG: ABC transporter ATP-binding protein [Enterocloster clostridioformis]